MTAAFTAAGWSWLALREGHCSVYQRKGRRGAGRHTAGRAQGEEFTCRSVGRGLTDGPMQGSDPSLEASLEATGTVICNRQGVFQTNSLRDCIVVDFFKFIYFERERA